MTTAGRMPTTLVGRLGARLPVVAAPMAGGPSTPSLVLAAASVGALGFLAGGYKTVDQLAEQVRAVRAETDLLGVNLFVPNPVPIAADAFDHYREQVRAVVGDGEAGEAGAVGPADGPPVEDDDGWDAKVDLLVDLRPPVASFTFGLVPGEVVDRLRGAGVAVVQTVTSLDEASTAASAGVDGLVVQGSSAGGHSGTWTPAVPVAEVPLAELVERIRSATGLPVWAAGGVTRADQVGALLASGAEAVCVGTALLRTAESGASASHQRGLAELGDRPTTVTRAFTGRPARAIANRFVRELADAAPDGYPALHHLTSALRRAAAARGDLELLHLWAGTGFADASTDPVGQVLRSLVPTAP